MSEDLLDPTPDPLKVTPSALMSRASSLTRRADENALRARKDQDELSTRKDSAYEQHVKKRDSLTDPALDASKDLAATAAKGPEAVAMPKADLGPTMDQGKTRDFLFGVLGMALVGAKGGRQHFQNSLAAMNGALKGFKEGNIDLMKDKQAEFKREFDVAMEKQRQANDKYRSIIDSKTMSLNTQMTMIAIEAKSYGDEVTYQKAKQQDIDGIWKQVNQGEVAAQRLTTQAAKFQNDIDKRREKAEAKEKATAAAKGGPNDTAETMAWDYLIRGHSPPARGGAYQAAMKRVGEIAKENGMTPQELVSASADVKTKLSAKRQFEVRTQNITRAENQLMQEIPVMEDAMKQLDLPSIPIAARGKIEVLRQMGDPNVTKLDQAAEAVFNEFEGIITGNPGTLNVQDVQSARHAYEQAQTPQQMRAAVEGMRRIITNAKKANDITRDEIMGGINESLTKKPGGGAGTVLKFDAQGNQL